MSIQKHKVGEQLIQGDISTLSPMPAMMANPKQRGDNMTTVSQARPDVQQTIDGLDKTITDYSNSSKSLTANDLTIAFYAAQNAWGVYLAGYLAQPDIFEKDPAASTKLRNAFANTEELFEKWINTHPKNPSRKLAKHFQSEIIQLQKKASNIAMQRTAIVITIT